ncbi:hypothetical protein MHTCC0001_10190 [Flavobacteriaceae bacterium MHTCC 0001]
MKNIIVVTITLIILSSFNSQMQAQAVYNGSYKHTFTTNYGNIEIGPFNSSWAHIYTDRPKVIFNRPVYSVANTFSSYNNDLILQTEGNTRMVINDDTGNVGIGTTNPISKLQVNGDFYLYSDDAYNSGWGKTHFFWRRHSLIMGTPTGVYAHNLIELKPGGSSRGEIYSALEFYQATGENNHERRIRITSNNSNPTFFNAGNVGIGTTTPDSKLTVAGNIHAQEVKVTVNAGADFVFEEDYALPSLQQLEQFIKTNKHLPEIASEKEMQENGLHLAEMNIKLLQKIEELTLYVIEQNKSMERQELRIYELEQLLKTIQK